jgi:hypothetical protein
MPPSRLDLDPQLGVGIQIQLADTVLQCPQDDAWPVRLTDTMSEFERLLVEGDDMNEQAA